MHGDDPLARQVADEIARLRRRVVELEADAGHYRHEAETLACSERHYRTLVQNVTDIIFAISPDGHITSVNPAVTAITGWLPEQLIDHPLIDIVHPGEIAEAEHRVADCLRGHEIPPARVRVLCRSGEYCTLEARMSAELGEGRVVGILGVARDVTLREEAEKALRETSRRQQQLLSSARHLTASLDLKEVLTRIAMEARTILQAYGSAIYLLEQDGHTLTPVVAVEPPYEEAILAAPLDVRHSLTGQAIIARRGVIFNDAADSPIGYQIPHTPSPEDERVLTVPLIVEDEVLGAMCLNRTGDSFAPDDLTLAETFATYAATALRNARLYRDLEAEIEERRRAQEALRESERLYRSLFEQASDAIFVETADDRIVDVNQRACDLLGYTRDELLQLTVLDIVPSEVRRRAGEVLTCQATGVPAPPVEGYNLHKDGTLIPVEASVSWVEGQEQNLSLAIVRDITVRKLTEEALHHRTEQLEALRCIGLEMTNELDPDALLRFIVSSAVGLLGKQTGGLYLYRPERDLLEWFVASGPGLALIGNTLHRGEGMAGRILETGQPMVIDDYHSWEGRAPSQERYAPPSVIGVPVRWGEELLGVIGISGDRVGDFTAEDVEVLSLFAAQAAVAIKNARLFEETQRQSLRLSQALTVSEALHHGLDLEQVLEQIAQGAVALGFERAAINVREPQGDEVRVHAVVGLADTERQALMNASHRWSSFEALMQDRFLVSRSYLIRQGEVDWGELFDGVAIPTHTHDRGSGYWAPEDALMVPLWDSQGQPIGALSLDEPRDGLVPGLGIIQTLETYANQAALAIENARLYREARLEIAERRRIEEALRASETKYRTLVEGAAQPIITISRDGQFIYVNHVAARLFGSTPEDMIGRNVFDILPRALVDHDTTDLRCILERIVTSGESCSFEREMMVNGQSVYLQARGHPLRNAQGEIDAALIIAMDISEQRRLEERLREAELLEAVGRLAGGVAHEFNNLLTVINGYSEFLLNGMPEDSDLHNEAQEIHRAGVQAANLTRQLLAFGRRQMLRLHTLNLNDVVGSLTSLLEHASSDSVTLSLSLAPDLGTVMADPRQIEQVIVSLATNAGDAMPGGGILTVRTANVTLDASPTTQTLQSGPGQYVLLAIGDTGHGISDQVREHLFEPFFTTKEVGQGTGLGLASVYGIVRQLGGIIQVESRLGEGTTFHIYLPRTDVEESHYASLAELSRTHAILVVEADEPVRRLAVRMLHALGYGVLATANASMALNLLRNTEVDLVITDILMPDTSGQVFAGQVRRLCPNVRVLYMSGYSEEAMRHHGLLAPDMQWVQKPFDQSRLADAVSRALASDSSTTMSGHEPMGD